MGGESGTRFEPRALGGSRRLVESGNDESLGPDRFVSVLRSSVTCGEDRAVLHGGETDDGVIDRTAGDAKTSERTVKGSGGGDAEDQWR